MTALQVIDGFRAVGGRLIPAGDGLRWESPVEPPRALIEAAKERKLDLLMLLGQPEIPCPTCGTHAWQRDSVGAWACGACQPDSVFGPLPAYPAEAEAEFGLRTKLRQPGYAALTISQPVVSGNVRVCQIAAAAVVWAAGGPEELARRHAAAWDGISPALLEGHAISFRPAPGALAIGEWVRTPSGSAAEVLAHDTSSGEVLLRTRAPPPRWAWCSDAALVSEFDWEGR
ncbi:MAG: hypothetical protein ACRD1Y_01655 [Terriglobales bacterium]